MAKVNPMIRVYANLVINGRRDINDVPANIREEVRAAVAQAKANAENK